MTELPLKQMAKFSDYGRITAQTDGEIIRLWQNYLLKKMAKLSDYGRITCSKRWRNSLIMAELPAQRVDEIIP
jgi:hypothetical protein